MWFSLASIRNIQYFCASKYYFVSLPNMTISRRASRATRAFVLWLFIFFGAGVGPSCAQEAGQFPYPAMPQTLTTVEERSHYLLTHYWDNIDFADTLLLQQQDIGEQGFVNFIDLLPRFPQSAQEALDIFVAKAFDNIGSKDIFLAYIDQYLDSQDAPTRNDLVYAQLLSTLLSSDSIQARNASLTEEERSRLGYKLKNISKNQVGTTATDFSFIDRQGTRHSLSDYKGQQVVLFFYSPDCERCHYIAKGLKQEPLLQGVTVLAIYPADDHDLWQAQTEKYPSNWTDGYSPNGEIDARQLYYIRSTPSIYLLDKEQKVVLKDTDANTLLEKLKN